MLYKEVCNKWFIERTLLTGILQIILGSACRASESFLYSNILFQSITLWQNIVDIWWEDWLLRRGIEFGHEAPRRSETHLASYWRHQEPQAANGRLLRHETSPSPDPQEEILLVHCLCLKRINDPVTNKISSHCLAVKGSCLTSRS